MSTLEFTRGTLPSAQSYQDREIIVIESTGARTRLFSDGASWRTTLTVDGTTDPVLSSTVVAALGGLSVAAIEAVGLRATVTVSSAELLELNATPKTIIAAPGAGLAIIPRRVMVYKPAGVAYDGVAADEDIVLKYTDASGAECSPAIEATGFLDQATAQTRVSGMLTTNFTPTANAAVVLHLLTGEIATGDSPIYVRVWYDVVATVFTS